MCLAQVGPRQTGGLRPERVQVSQELDWSAERQEAQPADLVAMELVSEAFHCPIPAAVGEAVARSDDRDRRLLPRTKECRQLADRIRLGASSVAKPGGRRWRGCLEPLSAARARGSSVRAADRGVPACRNRIRDDLARAQLAAVKGMGEGTKHRHGGRLRGRRGNAGDAEGLQPPDRWAGFRRL